MRGGGKRGVPKGDLRIRQGEGAIGVKGEFDADGAPAFVRLFEGEAVVVAVETLEAGPGIGESDVRARIGGERRTGSVVGDAKQEVPADAAGLDAKRSAVLSRHDAVLDGILDEGLQQERRYTGREGRRFDIFVDGETVAEADLLDLQVAAGEVEFVGQGHLDV
jgi:hypothetical protein